MAALSNPIERQNIVDRFADYVRGSANTSISWGTNSWPFGEWNNAPYYYAGIFGGDTNGKGIEVSGGSIATGANGEITAQYVYDTLIAETVRYTRIRLIRARLVVDGGGGNNGSRPTAGVIYDQTAVAHLHSGYQVGVGADRSDVWASNTATSGGMEAMFDSMRANYNWARGQSAGTFEVHVCHASCHSNCHSSRGRR